MLQLKMVIKAAELCCINIIANVKKGLEGDWGRLESFVKA